MIGDHIIRLAEITSTNTYASDHMVSDNYAEGTVVFTNAQTHGKGQQGNSWESEAGKNLTVSVILYPGFLKPEKQFYLNKFVSLAVIDFIRALEPDRLSPKIKWPNDIYIGNSKIGGILIENTIMSDTIKHSVIGIGININQQKFSESIPNPASLFSATGKEFNIEDCLKELCSALNKRYSQLLSEKHQIDTDYLNNIFRLNIISDFLINGSIIPARITGISDHGRLMLCNKMGITTEYAFKEIEYII